MKKIVECVPNFSEGRDQEIIEAIARAIRETVGCTLLDVDAGHSTNRTVYTFVGEPASVIESALAGARVAKELIDMRKHQGEHPRFGALDVCPFIPVAGVTMEECVEVSRIFAKRASEELGIPLYLYEESAEQDYRRALSDLREGEYEGLERKIGDARWKPDFGPDAFLPQWGVTATGARNFLIAYNVNLLATPNQAHRIALNLREAGRGVHEPGRLAEVKGMGWFVGEYNMAQVTVNLTNYKVTPIHVLFEEVKKEAEILNLPVTGSEIVGLVPLDALIDAAEYYIEKENYFVYEEDQKIRLAIDRLGLNTIDTFDPQKRIIEFIVAEKPAEPLATMSVREFIEEVGSRSSAPGGGSTSALLAAIGVGLGSMVAKLTHGVRKFEKVQPQMEKVIPSLHTTVQSLIPMIDADTAAFNDFMVGLKMPKDTEEERRIRKEIMQEGLKKATEVPLTTMRLGNDCWDAMVEVARFGNPASKSDIQVGARALETGIWGAYQNVLINMVDIEDETFKNRVSKEAEYLERRAKGKCREVLEILEGDGV